MDAARMALFGGSVFVIAGTRKHFVAQIYAEGLLKAAAAGGGGFRQQGRRTGNPGRAFIAYGKP